MELISLVKHGVSNIVVTDVPDLSETPAYSKDSKTKEKAANVFNYFHSQWKNMFQSLKVDYGKQINDFELSAVVKETLSELGKKGMNIKEGASDINFYESFLSTGVLKPILKPGVTLDKVNDYFFVDSVHPTEKASQVIGTKLAEFITNKIKKNLNIK